MDQECSLQGSSLTSTSAFDSTVMILVSFTHSSHFYFQSAPLDQKMKSTCLGQSGARNTAGYITILAQTLHFVTHA